MTPYYQQDGITIYHADCADVLPSIDPADVDLLFTDPPYGIGYSSGQPGKFNGATIHGDHNTTVRDDALALYPDTDKAVFGSWRCLPPRGTKQAIVWDKGEGVGMGDLSFPFRPNFELVFLGGTNWRGHRGSSVVRDTSIVSWSSGPVRRFHPTEKPVGLIRMLLEKHPGDGLILDPFMGSGPVAQACFELGRRYIGIEIEEQYCAVTVERRFNQMSLFA